MANDGTGTGWDETHPNSTDNLSAGATEIVDLRKGVRLREGKEHTTPGTSSAGGVHLQGSAVGYFAASAPTTRPNSDPLTNSDNGRLWWNTSNNSLYILTNGTSGTWTQLQTGTSGASVSPTKHAIIQDLKTAGTDGGTLTQGTWQTRALTNVVADPQSVVGGPAAVTGNTVQIAAAGTYRVIVYCPGVGCDLHQCRLNLNNGGTNKYFYGCTAFSPAASAGFSYSILDTEFTTTGADHFIIEQICETTKVGIGMGFANTSAGANWPTLTANGRLEVYTSVSLSKLQ